MLFLKTAFNYQGLGPGLVAGLLILITWPGWVQANGGTILLVETAGPYEITITASSYPLRVGVNDVNTLVERRSDLSLVLDAQVSISAEPFDQPGYSQTFSATHDTATNKLYYHANVVLPTPGRWKLAVRVDGPEGSASTTFETQVEQSRASPLFRYLSLVGLPLVVITFLFFVLRRRATEGFNSDQVEALKRLARWAEGQAEDQVISGPPRSSYHRVGLYRRQS